MIQKNIMTLGRSNRYKNAVTNTLHLGNFYTTLRFREFGKTAKTLIADLERLLKNAVNRLLAKLIDKKSGLSERKVRQKNVKM